jgi:hypothetical protein
MLFWALLAFPSTSFADLLGKGGDASTTSEYLLVFEDIRPLDPPYAGHVFVRIVLDGDEVLKAEAFADYNEKSTNVVEMHRLEVKDAELSGELSVRIGPDGARRGRAHFPTPDDEFKLTFSVKREDGVYAAIRKDREAFMPPWRKDTPAVAGEKVVGTYEGAWSWKDETEERKGTVSGSWRPLGLKGGWSPQGPAVLKSTEKGIEVQAFLPEQDSVSHFVVWAERSFETPTSLEGKALQVRLGALNKAASVDQLAVSVMVKTERGWFSAMDAVMLSKLQDKEVVLSFAEFGDRWRPFSGSALQAIRLGVMNGDGIGQVAFTIQSLDLIEDEKPTSVKDAVVRIVVLPEVVKSFNGVDTIQDGLFGFHDVGESSPRNAKEGELDPVAYMEVLRPGYLRPLTHTGFGGKGHDVSEVFTQRARAAGAEDLVVWTHTMDLWARPPWLDGGVEPLAERVKAFYAVMADESWTPEHPDRVLRYFEVWNEPFMWGRHINMGYRLPEGNTDAQDPTQYGYIPGKVGADAWSELFLAAVEGGKSKNPHLKFGGPSVPDITAYGYKDFVNYTLRILQRVGDQLDFFTEHHYGGNPLVFSASYEVVRAVMLSKFDRQIPVINTEANDLGASDAGKAIYNITEILNLIQTQPDLVVGRALHANWNGYLRNKGEEDAWKLMAPLRGKTLDLAVDQDRMTAVAAYSGDGTVVVLGVDHGFGDTPIQVSLPSELRLQDATLLLTDTPAAELQIRDVDGAGVEGIAEGKTRLVDFRPQISSGVTTFTLPERSAFRLVYRQEGFEPHRTRSQRLHLMPFFLKKLAPEEEISMEVKEPIDPERLFLRIAYTGELRLRSDEGEIVLPQGPGRSDEAELRTIEIPPVFLESKPRLVAGEGGSLVLTAGWVVEE